MSKDLQIFKNVLLMKIGKIHMHFCKMNPKKMTNWAKEILESHKGLKLDADKLQVMQEFKMSDMKLFSSVIAAKKARKPILEKRIEMFKVVFKEDKDVLKQIVVIEKMMKEYYKDIDNAHKLVLGD